MLSPQDLESRVFIDEVIMNTIVWRELADPTPESVRAFGVSLKSLSEGLSEFSLLIDLLETSSPPSAPVRKALKEAYSLDNMTYISVFTGKNSIMNMAARFVLGGALKGTPFTIWTTEAEARGAIEQHRATSGAQAGRRADA